MDAVPAVAGDDVERAEPGPEEARFLVRSDPTIIHYQIAEPNPLRG
jgi:hypothetical protein